jgi:hypothetical protein
MELQEPELLLHDVRRFLGKFIAYPHENAQAAHALWIAHTHFMDSWASTPRLAFLSPEPASGKTRALEISELLVPRPVEAVNVSPAYLFRKVDAKEGRPTILFDEIDTVFGPRAKENEEIRGLLNAGHRKGAVAGRCVVRGKIIETEEIPAYCAVALAGLGEIPDTILTRAVVIRMKRRAPGENIQPFRRRVHAAAGNALRDRLAAWAATVGDELTDAWPEMPQNIKDRDADVWEPLLAIADAAGGHWPETARCSAVALVADTKGGSPSLGILLLRDVQAVFAENTELSTEKLLEGLHKIIDSPWGDLRGKPLDARGLAQRLRKYGVKSKDIRIDGRVLKGYSTTDLYDTFMRYLGVPAAGRATSATSTDDNSVEYLLDLPGREVEL